MSKIDKYKQISLYIMSKDDSHKISKIKLACLLYLCDFSYFYNTLKSISGIMYICKEFGPLANEFLKITGLTIKDCKYDFLSMSELKEIDSVCEKWKDIEDKKIVDHIKKQKPWMACKKGEKIPYELILQEDF